MQTRDQMGEFCQENFAGRTSELYMCIERGYVYHRAKAAGSAVYVPLQQETFAAVKPGLECPPRDCSSAIRTWNDQFDNDVWYVQHLSFKTDVKMVLNLIRFTLDRKNAEVRSAAGRGDFMGYSEDGKAISLGEVPDEYIEKVMEEMAMAEDAKKTETVVSQGGLKNAG